MKSRSNPLLWRIVKNVSIIGSGNVATHLAINLFNKGITIHSVYSRTMENAEKLASQVNALGISRLEDLDLQVIDGVIIALKDDVIENISNQLQESDVIVAHTSGTVPLSALKKHSKTGVFYPLQTFSKTKALDFSKVPMCIEGYTPDVHSDLMELAHSISEDVRSIDSDTRKHIHVAAVFACNFTNHMLTIANQQLGKSHQDLSILEPLIRETIDKAFTSAPEKVQTGPAARNDQQVIQKHLDMLAGEPQLQNIYTQISNSIINWKK